MLIKNNTHQRAKPIRFRGVAIDTSSPQIGCTIHSTAFTDYRSAAKVVRAHRFSIAQSAWFLPPPALA
jgi:hypothetical protein